MGLGRVSPMSAAGCVGGTSRGITVPGTGGGVRASGRVLFELSGVPSELLLFSAA